MSFRSTLLIHPNKISPTHISSTPAPKNRSVPTFSRSAFPPKQAGHISEPTPQFTTLGPSITAHKRGFVAVREGQVRLLPTLRAKPLSFWYKKVYILGTIVLSLCVFVLRHFHLGIIHSTSLSLIEIGFWIKAADVERSSRGYQHTTSISPGIRSSRSHIISVYIRTPASPAATQPSNRPKHHPTTTLHPPSTSQHHPPPNPQKTPTMPLLARRFSITNFVIAVSALGFQVSVLYPWHMKLDEDFAALRKENVRLARLVEQKFRIGAAASLEGKEERKGKVEGKA